MQTPPPGFNPNLEQVFSGDAHQVEVEETNKKPTLTRRTSITGIQTIAAANPPDPNHQAMSLPQSTRSPQKLSPHRPMPPPLPQSEPTPSPPPPPLPQSPPPTLLPHPPPFPSSQTPSPPPPPLPQSPRSSKKPPPLPQSPRALQKPLPLPPSPSSHASSPSPLPSPSSHTSSSPTSHPPKITRQDRTAQLLPLSRKEREEANQAYLEIIRGQQTKKDKKKGKITVQMELPNQGEMTIHEQTVKDLERTSPTIQGNTYLTFDNPARGAERITNPTEDQILQRRKEIIDQINNMFGGKLPDERIAEIIELLCSQTIFAPLVGAAHKRYFAEGFSVMQNTDIPRVLSINITKDKVEIIAYTALTKMPFMSAEEVTPEILSGKVTIKIPKRSILDKPMSQLSDKECDIQIDIET